MKKALICDVLCCPVDLSFPLRLEGAVMAAESDDIVEGVLRCAICDAEFPISSGIPNFIRPVQSQADEIVHAKLRETSARDADADGYDATISAYHSKMELDVLLQALQPSAQDTIIDLGAGTGRLTYALAASGASVLALDISARSLAISRARAGNLPVQHIACDVCNLPVRDGVATKAGSAMMLEHLPSAAERQRSLDEMYRTLKPGGRLALTAYNFTLTKQRRGDREGFHSGGLYYYRMYPAELRQLLARFRLQRLTAILGLPRGWEIAWLDRLITSLPAIARLRGQLLVALAIRPKAETHSGQPARAGARRSAATADAVVPTRLR